MARTIITSLVVLVLLLLFTLFHVLEECSESPITAFQVELHRRTAFRIGLDGNDMRIACMFRRAEACEESHIGTDVDDSRAAIWQVHESLSQICSFRNSIKVALPDATVAIY